HLSAEALKRIEQGGPPTRIEMRRDLVQERDRHDAGHVGDQPRMRKHESEKQSLLLPGRGARRRRILRTVPHREIADMGADRRPARGCIAAAVVAQYSAIAILGRDCRAIRDERFNLSFKRQPGPRKGRGVVPLGRDQRREAAHAFEPRRGHCDTEFGGLALHRVQPRGIARALLEEAIAPAQRPLELTHPRAVARIDGENESVKEAAAFAGRARKKRIHRRRQPDDAHMIAEGARRGESSDKASSRLVFPAPFSPHRTTRRRSIAKSSVAYERKSCSMRRRTSGRRRAEYTPSGLAMAVACAMSGAGAKAERKLHEASRRPDARRG